MQIKKILDSLNYEKQIFVRLMVLVTIPLIVMGVVSFNIYIRSESAKSHLALDSYSTEVFREYESILTSIKEYYMEMVTTEEFHWLERQSEIPYSRYSSLKKAQKNLEGYYFIQRYIESYNFINLEQGWIFNNYGLFPYDKLQNKTETEAFLTEQREISSNVYWIKRTEAVAPVDSTGMRLSNSVDATGFQLVLKESDGGELGIPWLLAVKIDEKAWYSMAENYQKAGYEISILGGVEGEVLLETNPEMTQYYLEHDGERTVSGLLDGGKGRYRIQVKRGGSNGMSYVIGYDSSQVRRDATVFVFASFAVIAGCAALFLVVRLMTMAFAKPLYNLQSHVEDQNLQIKELLVSNLVKGELNEPKIEEALKKSGILPFRLYRMLALICKGEVEEEELKERYTKILTNLSKELREEVFITPVFYRDRLVFLVGAETESELDIKVAGIYKRLKDEIEGRYGLTTASGISQVFDKLSGVRQAYNECSQALYNQVHKEEPEASSLVLYEDYLKKAGGSNVYDMIMENELIQAISSCKEEEAAHILELIIERMESKGVIGIERSFYLTRLLTAVLHIPEKAGIPLSDIFGSEQYNILNQMTQIYDRKKLLRAVEVQMIHPLIEKLSQKEKSGEELEVVTEMMELIRESKGNISLNECAEKLSYHPNYLSKVLKREKGLTFTDMANEEKLKQAKYMLLTTEYSVAEISEKLQYNNVQNFIRFFKNHENVTPAAFRKERRN